MRLSIQPREVQCAGQLTCEGSFHDAGGSHHETWELMMTVTWCDDGVQVELQDQDAPGAQPIATPNQYQPSGYCEGRPLPCQSTCRGEGASVSSSIGTMISRRAHLPSILSAAVARPALTRPSSRRRVGDRDGTRDGDDVTGEGDGRGLVGVCVDVRMR